MAAGLSDRMGGTVPKQLLPRAGRPLVAIAADAAVGAQINEVVVVTGHHAEEVSAAVADLDVRVAFNADYRDGNMTSLRAGYAALGECDAYVVLLADMPEVTTAMINRLIARWESDQAWAVVASYRDKDAHPLLLSAEAMKESLSDSGANAVWRMLASAPEGAVVREVFAREAPIDVNTPDDYRALGE